MAAKFITLREGEKVQAERTTVTVMELSRDKVRLKVEHPDGRVEEFVQEPEVVSLLMPPADGTSGKEQAAA